MDPINYQIQVADPFKAALSGYQGGAAVRDDIQQQQQYQIAQQQVMAQREQQQRVLSSLISNKNANAQDYANASLLVPGMKDNFKQAFEMRNADQQQSQLRNMGQAFSAVVSGRPDLAVSQLNAQADAMETAGVSAQEVQALRAQAKIIDAHPEFARSTIGMQLAALPGGDKFISGAAGLSAEERTTSEFPYALDRKKSEAVQARADASIKVAQAGVAPEKVQQDLTKGSVEIEDTRSQMADRAARLGLDRDKLTSEVQLKVYEHRQKNGELPEYVAKEVTTATTDAIVSQQSASRMSDLADQIELKLGDASSGVVARSWEGIKRAGGWQNETTRLRSEYSRIVTPAAMAAYKKVSSGSTSDKDIDVAMIGVPKDTDPPERMVSFLRGVAKLQVYDTVLNNARAEWLGANKYLGKAKDDIEIDGVKVPAGMTFKQFSDTYVDRKAGELSAAARMKSLAAKYGAQAGPATESRSGATRAY